MTIRIEKLGTVIQEKVIDLKANNLSNSQIATEINAKYNPMERVTDYDVAEFLRKMESKSIKLLQEKGEFQKNIAAKYFNTVDQMSELNLMMWNKFVELNKELEEKDKTISCPHCERAFKVKVKDWASYTKLGDALLSHIKHVDQVLGKLQKASLNVTYNILDINQKIQHALPDVLDKMRREGKLDSVLRAIKRQKRAALSYEVEEEKEEEPEL